MSANKQTNMPIYVPAGAPLDTLLPDYARYASKVPLETCPYDPNHRVKPTRLRGHMIKCARAAKTPLATCYYDVTHRVPPAELEEHLKKCPSKIDVAPMSTELSASAPFKVIASKTVSQPIDDDDDWD